VYNLDFLGSRDDRDMGKGPVQILRDEGCELFTVSQLLRYSVCNLRDAPAIFRAASGASLVLHNTYKVRAHDATLRMRTRSCSRSTNGCGASCQI
jgi:hypothetical protein